MTDFVLPDAPARDDAWPAPLPPVLSPTQINTILTCPEQYRRVYLKGEYSRPSGALIIGSADSDAAEHNYRQKITTHRDLPVADVEFVAAHSFEKRVADEDPTWEDKPGESNPGEALDTTIRVVRAYHGTLAPKIQPATVEETVELAVEGVVPLVRARVDLTTDGQVISRKTSARRVNSPKPGWLNQSAIESAATGLPSIWHVSTKAKTPDVSIVRPDGEQPSAVRAARVVQAAVDQAVAMLERYGPDEPWPGNFATFAPPCSFCAFRPTCWWHP